MTPRKGPAILPLLLLALSTGAASSQAGMVFSVLQEDHWQVYYQQGVGTHPQRISLDEALDQTMPCLSGDGMQVAFETGSEVRLFRLSDGDDWVTPVGIIRHAARPAWEPGTSDWLFVRYEVTAAGEDSDIYLRNPERTTSPLLLRQTANQDYISASPDGRYLAYSSGTVVAPYQGAIRVHQELWVFDLRAKVAKQITHDGFENIESAWSPSGQELAFSSNRSGRFEIWAVKPDGSGLRQITRGPGIKTHPAWSPDGLRMLVTTMRDGRYGLAMVDVEDGSMTAYQPFAARPQAEVRDADWR